MLYLAFRSILFMHCGEDGIRVCSVYSGVCNMHDVTKLRMHKIWSTDCIDWRLSINHYISWPIMRLVYPYMTIFQLFKEQFLCGNILFRLKFPIDSFELMVKYCQRMFLRLSRSRIFITEGKEIYFLRELKQLLKLYQTGMLET